MKLLILTNKLGNMDGWERYSEGLSDALTRSGVEVVVACYEKNPNISYRQFPILPSALSLRSNYFFAWHQAFKVLRLVKKGEFDVVH